MAATATTIRSRRARHRPAGWIWIVVALLVVAPVRGWSLDGPDAAGPRPHDHAHAGDAPAWSTADIASTKPDTNDRRDTPGGTPLGVAIYALGALVVGIAVRTRTVAPSRPLVAFRRRGPPRLQPVR